MIIEIIRMTGWRLFYFCRWHGHARRDGSHEDVLRARGRRRGVGGRWPGGGGHAERRQLFRRDVPVGIWGPASRQRAGRHVLQPVLAVGDRVYQGHGPVPQVQGPRDLRAGRPRQPDGQLRAARGPRRH